MQLLTNKSVLQEANPLPALELRKGKSIATSAVLFFIIFIGIMIREKYKEGLGTDQVIFLILFIAVGIFTLIHSFDKSPDVIINQEGIRNRKHHFPFSPLILMSWNDIQYFFLREIEEEYGSTFYIMIRERETEKDRKLTLSGYDSSAETILSLIRQYAEKHNIHELDKQTS
ncbi:hypothetical protein A4D02_33695 [Niastella koreensis]|uniref:DUF5673 domain-containing protein n=1 Tax=Niastella koreensis TaxID=354356 RepID=A0ABX3NU86_9BACT|nr:hypothetical protein A4D02_33695 [Niastella koreensis]